jgi:hypothetical protein
MTAGRPPGVHGARGSGAERRKLGCRASTRVLRAPRPSRCAFGYMPDVDVPAAAEPIDFAAWARGRPRTRDQSSSVVRREPRAARPRSAGSQLQRRRQERHSPSSETPGFTDLYRRRAAVERKIGRLKNEWELSPLRVPRTASRSAARRPADPRRALLRAQPRASHAARVRSGSLRYATGPTVDPVCLEGALPRRARRVSA